MATFEITAVRTIRDSSHRHEHITAVQLNRDPSFIISRATVIADLRSVYGDRYYTYGGGQYADVVVRSCPYCGYSDYITTLPDSTVENNLLHLPRI